MAVTEESVIRHLREALGRRFGVYIEIMPRTSTKVVFKVWSLKGPMFIAFSDSYLAGCANRSRQMLETDHDLKLASTTWKTRRPIGSYSLRQTEVSSGNLFENAVDTRLCEPRSVDSCISSPGR
jgi:hypothetical protein